MLSVLMLLGVVAAMILTSLPVPNLLVLKDTVSWLTPSWFGF